MIAATACLHNNPESLAITLGNTYNASRQDQAEFWNTISTHILEMFQMKTKMHCILHRLIIHKCVCNSSIEHDAEIFLVKERRRKNQREWITGREKSKIQGENNQAYRSFNKLTDLMVNKELEGTVWHHLSVIGWSFPQNLSLWPSSSRYN